MAEYFCGAVETENGLAYISPIYHKIGPFGIWISENESRKLINDFEADNGYKFETIFLNESRQNPFGIIAFSKDPAADFTLSPSQLETLVKTFDEKIVKARTGEPKPKTWTTEVKGSAIILRPEY